MKISNLLRIGCFLLPLFFFTCKTSKNDPAPSPLATIRIDSVGSIKSSAVKVYCTIVSEGTSAVASAGVAWSTKANPTVFDNLFPAPGFGVGSFVVEIKGLAQGTAYNLRAFATNFSGTAYSEQKSFTSKLKNVPVVTTGPATGVGDFTATLGGTIVDSSFSTKTEHGVCWGLRANPSLGETDTLGLEMGSATLKGISLGTYTIPVSGLKPGKTYHVRAFATNGVGTGYGEDVLFSTNPLRLPTVLTGSTVLSYSSARLSGSITEKGNVAYISSTGICYGKLHNPTTDLPGTKYNSFSSDNFSNYFYFLTENTTYYARAFVVTSDGLSYGNEVEFTTPLLSQPGAGVTDIDGNHYPTVKLGTQEWMAENLRVTKFNNGTAIILNPNNATWQNTTGGNSNYASAFLNDNSYVAQYGLLYNGYVVLQLQNNNVNVCPTGWKVPTKDQLDAMVGYLGGSYSAGDKMKSTTGWNGSAGPGTNISGFSSLPSARRNVDGSFENMGIVGYWWTRYYYSFDGTFKTWYQHKDLEQIGYDDYTALRAGYSIRCIKE